MVSIKNLFLEKMQKEKRQPGVPHSGGSLSKGQLAIGSRQLASKKRRKSGDR